MKNVLVLPLTMLAALAAPSAGGQSGFESDTFEAPAGPVTFTFIGHGTLMIQAGGTVIHVDPVGSYADYGRLPKADLVLVTHEHQDHLDAAAVAKLGRSGTVVLANAAAAGALQGAAALGNGESREVKGVRVEAVPAYNTTAGRDRFHPRGRGNGYLLTVAGLRVYVAGDSEDTAEMKALKGVDVAFLPMNQPYTMTPEQVAAAAKAFRPKVLYPYHYGDTDAGRLQALLKGEAGIEVRVRPLR